MGEPAGRAVESREGVEVGGAGGSLGDVVAGEDPGDEGEGEEEEGGEYEGAGRCVRDRGVGGDRGGGEGGGEGGEVEGRGEGGISGLGWGKEGGFQGGVDGGCLFDFGGLGFLFGLGSDGSAHFGCCDPRYSV